MHRRNLCLLGGLFLLLTGCAILQPVKPAPPPCNSCEAMKILTEKNARNAQAGQRNPEWAMPFTSKQFYQRRNYKLAWTDNGALRPAAEESIAILALADKEGLNPDEYHVAKLKKRAASLINLESIVAFDAAMTDGVLLYASHLAAGHTNPQMARTQWSLLRKKVDLSAWLEGAISSNTITAPLDSLAPPHAGYKRLKESLAWYRNLSRNGNWPVVKNGPELKKGMNDPRVRALRTRLLLEVDGSTEGARADDLFDQALEKELKNFQRRAGIPASGKTDDETLTALNIPLNERIHQIKFNMDRWRWLPADLGERHLLVNIPDYKLFGIEGGTRVLTLPVIVGRATRQNSTPVFSQRLTYLEFSPNWNVPPQIASKEILQKIQEDAGFLERNHMEIVKRKAGKIEIIDPATIDWCAYTPAYFPFSVRQTPGPWNALGGVKFMFPNEYNVYIHGTNETHLFDQRVRTFSHGCVRSKNPVKLVKFVLKNAPWSDDEINQLMERPQPVFVTLAKPLPVFLVYWTAWVDDNGLLQFRNDVYGRDKDLKTQFYPTDTPR